MSDEAKTISKAMAPDFKPKTKAPYSRTDLQHYLTKTVTEKIDGLKMPRDAEHDRRFIRALGALAADYMLGEGCKDPQYVAALLVTGTLREYQSRLAKEAKEQFKAAGKPPPPYLSVVGGGDGGEEEPEEDGDEGGGDE